MTNRHHLILDSQIRAFAHGSLDEACSAIQRILDISSGDVAGCVFSGFDWNASDIADRMALLRAYVRTELAIEQ